MSINLMIFVSWCLSPKSFSTVQMKKKTPLGYIYLKDWPTICTGFYILNLLTKIKSDKHEIKCLHSYQEEQIEIPYQISQAFAMQDL